MSQAVVIKSNKYGIHLVLSNEISFNSSFVSGSIQIVPSFKYAICGDVVVSLTFFRILRLLKGLSGLFAKIFPIRIWIGSISSATINALSSPPSPERAELVRRPQPQMLEQVWHS